jgi:hypothetical protein
VRSEEFGKFKISPHRVFVILFIIYYDYLLFIIVVYLSISYIPVYLPHAIFVRSTTGMYSTR